MIALLHKFASHVGHVVTNIQTNFPTLLVGYVGFTVGLQLLQSYLTCRQLKKNRETEIPANVADLVNQEEFDDTQAYQADKHWFSLIVEWINYPLNLAVFVFVSPFMWESFSFLGNEYKQSIAWVIASSLLTMPISTMISLYKTFVIEERHGFNKMTLRLFIVDLIKSLLIEFVLMVILIPCIIWVVRNGGDNFYIYLWGFMQVLVFLMMWIIPTVIMPMFNKYEPLKDEELKDKIDELAAGLKFPLKKLFQVDGSKRSSHSNAYFFGFWKNKRIVLYDTLLTQTHDEILAILCHEMGHWHYNHVTQGLIITSIHLFAVFFAYGQVVQGPLMTQILQDFQYPANTASVVVSLTLFSALLTPIESVIQVIMTLRSRRNEFQADAFASEMGRGRDLMVALKGISKENKGELNPDAWYSWYHFSHPPLTERLGAIEKLEKKEK
eukprot:GEMP01038681.1.p1 GENE.GEMP01038681.1~~GEMP01038681.1.p1  ORF type:complete len:457 (+),score=72.77 GEMP01038681.1:52-1371(+)